MSSEVKQVVRWESLDNNRLLFVQSPSAGRLVSSSIPAPGISPNDFLDHGDGQERFYWQNEQDQIILAGFGKALEIMAWGAGRFDEVRSHAAKLFAAAILDKTQPEWASPRLFGGFSFRDDFTPDNAWSVFHPAHFIIPHYQFVQSGAETWLTINAMLSEKDDFAAVQKQLEYALAARYDSLRQFPNRRQRSAKPVEIIHIRYPMSFQSWREKISRAKSKMRSSEMEKVVLARVCELRAQKRIDVRKPLDFLNNHYHECTRFLFEPRPNHSFFGATPELLVKVKGNQLNTMALAGSIKRGANNQEDRILTRQLMESDKERLEHALVANSICRRLQPFTRRTNVNEQPEVYSLSYIHHLHTPIQAELRQSYGVLPLLKILHPTPALGGSPRQIALDFIRQEEPVPRGWFAGPIGWIDKNLDGEFGVAIRSAVAQERRVWLYAGAGIVANSDAEKEWAETSLKFHPMFAALGVDLTKLVEESR